jgi:hypothetical protein
MPNLRTVVVALGTSDILTGANVMSIEQKLTAVLGFTDPAA